MDETRRALLLSGLAAALGVGGGTVARAETAPATEAEAMHDMSAFPPEWTRPDKIAMLAYPGFTALDLVGPQYMFASLMGASVQVAARTRDPVRSDTGLLILPDATFDEVPADLTVLFLPGSGAGLLDALRDPATMRFIADRGARAEWVTSVCTGSLLLAAAGLLDGYRATSHWATEAALAELGATLDPARVVIDRNRVTGAGVTAGVDFGLSMIEILRDRDYAMMVQLLAQYDPAPPFDAGSPSSAPPHVFSTVAAMFPDFTEQAVAAGREARAALR